MESTPNDVFDFIFEIHQNPIFYTNLFSSDPYDFSEKNQKP